MTLDPWLIVVAATAFVLTILGILFDYIKQSILVAYVIAGIILGPFVLGVFTDPVILDPMAGLALILLLFFIGLEVDLRQLSSQWVVAIVGCLLQIVLSVGIVWIIGNHLDWPTPRIILMGFVITLSSTPIALRALTDNNLLNTRLGANTLGILVVQDLLAIPMLIILGAFRGDVPSTHIITLQLSSALLIIALIIYAIRHPGFRIPFSKKIENNREMQVLAALALCFGTAVITGLMHLSVVLGGFVAGILIKLSNGLKWVQSALEPFNYAFVAIFFVYIGVLIDMRFFIDHIWSISALAMLALVLNTVVNTITLMSVRENWRESLLAGASLAQLGEFGFVLAAIGLSSGIINQAGYQYVLAVTALSWIISPAWITAIHKLVVKNP